MLYQLENLNASEKELVLNAPALVTLLIAGADDKIEEEEIRRSLQLVHVKSYAEAVDIKEIYQTLNEDFEVRLSNLIDNSPRNLVEREAYLIEELTKLNRVYSKLDQTFALKFHASLQSFASYIAMAAGGIFGIESISEREGKFVKLPMVEVPKV